MVVKKQPDYGDKFALPLVNDPQEEAGGSGPLVGQARPQHERYDEPEQANGHFWRTWNEPKKIQEPLLPSWGSTQEEYVMAPPGGSGRGTIVFTAKKRKSSFWSFMMFSFVVLGLLTYWHLTMSLQMILSETEAMIAVRNQINIKLRSAEKDVRMLSREVSATEMMFQKRQEEKAEIQAREAAIAIAERDAAQKSLSNLQERVASFQEQTSSLRESVKKYSHDTLVRKYGTGRHLVEVKLEFPDDSDGPSSFVIELAPVEMMPHAVLTFLDMISNNLWDGCSFVMNAMHVIKAAPLPYDNSNGNEKAKAFIDRGLNGPSFREYTEEFPHKPLTVGFAGGNSPSFYINTEDNTEIHAGDSAFGKIVAGADTIKRLEASPTKNGIWFKERIGIKHAAILS